MTTTRAVVFRSAPSLARAKPVVKVTVFSTTAKSANLGVHRCAATRCQRELDGLNTSKRVVENRPGLLATSQLLLNSPKSWNRCVAKCGQTGSDRLALQVDRNVIHTEMLPCHDLFEVTQAGRISKKRRTRKTTNDRGFTTSPFE
jgi:hypothetical protein